MKELCIETRIKVYTLEELNEKDRELIQEAISATYRSYAPYSHFCVGAAARLANGIIVTGPTRKMQPTHLASAPNGQPFSMPTPNIPTKP